MDTSQSPPPSTATDIQTIAVLPLSGTTVTATVPPHTSGVAVVDGTTISFRHDGITLSNGQVFSLGFNGLVVSTTTAFYDYVTVSNPTQSVKWDSTRHPTGTSIIVTHPQDTTSLPPDTPYMATTSTVPSGQGETTNTEQSPLTSSGAQVSGSLTSGATSTASSSSSTSGMTGSSSSSSVTGSSSMSTTTTGSTSGAQAGPGESNAAPLTTNGGSGAPAQVKNVGLTGVFVAALGLVATFGAMVGL